MKYEGKKVLVTGGAGEIGSAVARAYAAEGALVILADKDYRGEQLVRKELQPLSPKSVFFPADLSAVKGCEELFRWVCRHYDDVDILISCAQTQGFGNLCETSAESWDYVLNTNLRAPFLLARDFAKNRADKGYKDRYGRIVHIGSSRCRMSEEGTEAYTASMGGLEALTHALAISLTGYNTTVNAVSPGWICGGDYESLRYSDHRQFPSGRVGRPEDVVRACLYLTDPENDFINGENLVLDGGLSKKLIYLD